MDATYVMLPAAEGAPPALRREAAMQQWIHLRADADYRAAVEAWDPAWDIDVARWAANGGGGAVAHRVRVAADESLGDAPLSFTFDRRSLPPTGDALIDALAAVDETDVLRSVEPSDPLAWRCAQRAAQHEWFYWNAGTAEEEEAPQPRSPPSPPPRPVLPEEHPPVYRRLTVEFDALAWPPRRRVTAPTPVLTGVPRPPVVVVVAAEDEPRRSKRRRGYSPERTSRSSRRRRSTSGKWS